MNGWGHSPEYKERLGFGDGAIMEEGAPCVRGTSLWGGQQPRAMES